MPSKKLRLSSFANHWQQVVTNVDEVSWTESQEAKLDTAMKRWYDIVLRFPLGIGIKDQMSLLADVPDQLRVLRDVFATKARLTLIKRANSLQQKFNFCTVKECCSLEMRMRCTDTFARRESQGALQVVCNQLWRH